MKWELDKRVPGRGRSARVSDGRSGLTMGAGFDGNPTQSCEWPSGERPPYAFCEAPALPGKSYCLTHYLLAVEKEPH